MGIMVYSSYGHCLIRTLNYENYCIWALPYKDPQTMRIMVYPFSWTLNYGNYDTFLLMGITLRNLSYGNYEKFLLMGITLRTLNYGNYDTFLLMGITLRTLNYGNYDTFLLMGIALRTLNYGNYDIFLLMGITLRTLSYGNYCTWALPCKDPKLWELWCIPSYGHYPIRTLNYGNCYGISHLMGITL